MSFTSLVFLLFLPGVAILHAVWVRRGWQNGLLLAANYVFYGWWDPRFLALIALSSLVDYHVGRAIGGSDSVRVRRRWLAVSLCVNLGLLGFFKYCNFFVDSAVIALAGLGVEWNTTTLQILLPVGISFYTFQTLSYTLDIHRGRIRPHGSLLEYLTFVSFFPQLVAGPIERAAALLPQFARARPFDGATAAAGCRLFLWGMFKKRVVADNLALLVEGPYGAPEGLPGGVLAVATLAFGFQVYCDFSGYSDMAAGMARLFGIQLQRNFAFPYLAGSPREFWRRWHITLSTWFRDYVFIPMGGGRGGLWQTARNLMVTFLLSGLWHGAAWTFVLWGAWHGTVLIVQRWIEAGWAGAVPARHRTGWRLAGVLGTFLAVQLGWVLFRSADLATAIRIFHRLATDLTSVASLGAGWTLVKAHWTGPVAAGVLLAVEVTGRHRWNPLPEPGSVVLRWALYSAVFWAILLGGARQVPDFIYFQF